MERNSSFPSWRRGVVAEIQTANETFWVTGTDWVRQMGAGMVGGLSVTTSSTDAEVLRAIGISPYQLVVDDQVLQTRAWYIGTLATGPVTDISIRC